MNSGLQSQYGYNRIDGDQLALERGSGNYNPSSVSYDKDYIRNVQKCEFDQSKSGWSQNTTMIDTCHGRQRNGYKRVVLKSLNIQDTPLTSVFFSDENVDYIQDKLIQEIKSKRGVKIDRQDDNALLQIMAGIFMESQDRASNGISKFGGVWDTDLKTRVSTLNKAVFQEIVKQVLNGIGLYLQYHKDASTLPVPLSRPTNMSSRGGKVLSENIGLYDGFSTNIKSFNEQNSVVTDDRTIPWNLDKNFRNGRGQSHM